MKNIDFNKYKEIWKMESGKIYGNARLSDHDIKRFLKGKSKDISQLFKMGLYIDISLKLIFTIAYAILVSIWKTTTEIAGLSVGLMLLSGFLGALQLRYLLKFPNFEISEKNLKNIINSKIDYYYIHYKKALYIGATSAPLFFLGGMLFYFFYKYGEIREFHIDDFIVFGSGIIISYIIAITSQLLQFKFQISQLKSCLQEINENAITELTLKKQKNQKIRIILAAVIFLTFGILLLLYIISNS